MKSKWMIRTPALDLSNGSRVPAIGMSMVLILVLVQTLAADAAPMQTLQMPPGSSPPYPLAGNFGSGFKLADTAHEPIEVKHAVCCHSGNAKGCLSFKFDPKAMCAHGDLPESSLESSFLYSVLAISLMKTGANSY